LMLCGTCDGRRYGYWNARGSVANGGRFDRAVARWRHPW
jgi:hypothetical protein